MPISVFLERCVRVHIEEMPVIESGPFYIAIGYRKTERFDEMQRRSDRRTGPCDISGILRDFGFHEHDVKRGEHHEIDCSRAGDYVAIMALMIRTDFVDYPTIRNVFYSRTGSRLGRRTVLSIACVFVLITTAVSAQQRIYNADHPVVASIRALYVETGIVVPFTSGPYSVEELELWLERIDRDDLSRAGKSAYDDAVTELAGRSLYGEKGGLSIDVKPAVTIEGYLHTDHDNDEWLLGSDDRASFFELPLTMQIGDSFAAMMDVEVRKERILVAEEPNDMFNITDSFGEIDYHFPFRAFLSVGGPHWNLQLGRDFLSWGNGLTGNFIVSDDAGYQEFLRATTFWRNFKYSAVFVGMENWDPDHIRMMADNKKTFLAHRIEIRLFDGLNVALTEGLMMETPYPDMSFYNPLMVFHNWFFNDYHGNIIFGVDGELTLTPWFYLYGQYVLDQRTSKYERETYPSISEPDSYGYLAGAEAYIPAGPGYITGRAEWVMTSPWLYLIEGQPKIISQRKIISNYLRKKLILTESLGYLYGPDTIVYTINTGYDVPSLGEVTLGFTYRIRGEKRLDSEYETGEEAMALRTPSGENPEITFIAIFGVTIKPFSFLEAGADLGYLVSENDDNVPGARLEDFQAVLRVSVTY